MFKYIEYFKILKCYFIERKKLSYFLYKKVDKCVYDKDFNLY